jgi:hypothetical protein
MSTIGKTREFTFVGGAAGALLLALAAAGCGGGGGTSAGPSACAFIQAEWAIEQAQTGAALNCAQAGADTVDMTANNMSMSFPCAAYGGISDPVIPGIYNISFDLLDVNGAPRAPTVGPMTFNLNGCATFDVTATTGPVIFDVP